MDVVGGWPTFAGYHHAAVSDVDQGYQSLDLENSGSSAGTYYHNTLIQILHQVLLIMETIKSRSTWWKEMLETSFITIKLPFSPANE